ncbi:MAG TPA: hemerythrin domain-containing protein [Reyranella sp.]|nr:hemerythrin domain-containing protein [Reyranella sp.]
MSPQFDMRRRGLIGVGALGGLVLAAPALADWRRQAEPKKAARNRAPINAPEDLMREHGVLERILLIYEVGGRRLGHGEDIDPDLFTQAAQTLRDFIHDYHEKSEEEEVFPRFKKAGQAVTLVDVLVAQHAAGRKLTETVIKLAPTTRNSSDQKKLLADAMQATITLYRPHVAREDTDIFPALHSLLTPGEFEELGETLEKKEGAKFGADGFEKAVKVVAGIEKKLGTDDIGQYTPKT